MATSGAHTLQEIKSQAEAWAAVLDAVKELAPSWQTFFNQGQDGLTLFFGCGSTFYLSLTAAAALQTLTGRPARGVPSAELFLYPQSWIPAGQRINGIAVSRSGTTTETLRASDYLSRQYQARLATITCYENTPLAGPASFTLVSPLGHEKSVAQTRSFSSMLVGCIALAALAGEQADLLGALAHLPARGQRLLQEQEAMARSLGQDLSISQVFFLGGGSRYGLAAEAMLKLKEMSLTHSEAFHFLEFRHGPKSMVDNQTLVVGLLKDAAQEAEVAVLRDVKALGARLLVLTESAEGLDWADHVVSFQTGLPELACLPLYLPVLQLFAFYRAVEKGLNPDAPRNLEAVVHL